MTTWLHEERFRAVEAELRACAARRVLDLGCGAGDLFLRLAGWPEIATLVGLDICPAALERLRGRLRAAPARAGRVELRLASVTDPVPDLAGFDCALMVETLEHLAPDRLSLLENALFHRMRPEWAVITTPNAEFNPLLGVPAHRFRHPGHRFEWTRAQFGAWCARVAPRAGYDVRLRDIAGAHPKLGGASQMAVFERRSSRGR